MKTLEGKARGHAAGSGDDVGASLRDAANATCGATVVGRDAFQVAAEIQQRGGGAAQLDRIINRPTGGK